MSYGSIDAWWWPFVFITLAAVLPNAMWRWAGVVLVGNLDENSQWLVLVRCIATSLVAAVIAQFVFSPSGALAAFPLELRLGAIVAGFGTFLLFKQRMILCVMVGEIVLLAGYLVLVP